jgi:hypothetical protein
MTLLENYAINSETRGIKNINCGILRRIGKTTTLIQMIKEYRSEHPEVFIILIIRIMQNARMYTELTKTGVVNKITTLQKLENIHSIGKRAFFSDGVYDADKVVGKLYGAETYIGGFYIDKKINLPEVSEIVLSLANYFGTLNERERGLVGAIRNIINEFIQNN